MRNEAKIVDEIYTLCEDKTLRVIAHRLSTIKVREDVYDFHDGQINAK